MFKASIFGAGFVGATAAEHIALQNFADVVLVDINEGAAQGKALDMRQTGPICLHSANITGSANYEATANSDIIVITAGVPRKEGMTRDDLLRINAQIVKSVAEEAIKYSPNAIFIVVTNPLDVMTQLVHQVTGLPAHKVIGMAGVLDSARFATFIAMELGISAVDIRAMVLGGHGDLMVPLLRHTSVSGVPVLQLIPEARLKELAIRTRDGGLEIVKLLKQGSAYYAPGASVAIMVSAILKDENRLLPCSVLATGEYGINDVYVGLPTVLGKNGVKNTVKIKLNTEEVEDLRRSAASIAANVKTMNELIGWGKTEEVSTNDEPCGCANEHKTETVAVTDSKPAAPEVTETPVAKSE